MTRARPLTRPGLALAATLLLLACPKPRELPTLTGVSPESGLEDRRVDLVITGERLAPALFTDFARRAGSTLASSWSARLGREALEDVALVDGALHAVVPAGLTPGRYDLVVVTPAGDVLTLPAAYQVLALDSAAALVAAFRFTPVGPQVAGVPFQISVAAVDASGRTVEGFKGTAVLTDQAGAVVPRQLSAFARGQWVGSVEVRAPRADEVLTVTDGAGHTGSSNAFVVAAGPGSSLRFTTPARTVAAGACSPEVSVEAVDLGGTPSPATADTPVALTSTPGLGFRFYADSACAVPLATPTLAAGASALSFYFRGSRSGTHQVRATAPGLGSALQGETITAGPPDRLAFTTAAPTVTAGVCSPVSTVEVRDAFDNPSPVPAALAITLTASPAAGFTFFGTASCGAAVTEVQVAAGSATVDLAFQGSTAGVVTMTASAPSLTAASQQARIIPQGFAAKLVIVSAAQTLPVGRCSGPLAVQTQDSLGNAVTNPGMVPVALSSTPASGLAFYADATCTTPSSALSLGSGKSTDITWFIGRQPGTLTARVDSPGLTGDAQDETILPGVPSRLAIVSPARSAVAGTCSSEVTVQVQDALGFATAVAADTTVALTATPATGFAMFSDPGCLTPASSLLVAAGGSSSRLYFKGTRAGSVTVQVQATGLAGAQQVETVTAGAPAQLVFLTAAQTVGAGACSGVATVELQDAFGNPAPAATARPVDLTALPGAGFAFSSDPGCTSAITSRSLGAGATTVSFFFRGQAVGAVAVTAASAGLVSALQTETIVAGAPAVLAWTTAPQTVAAGACSAAAGLEVRDASGNASPVLADTAVTLAASPATGFTFYLDASCTTSAAQVVVAVGGSAATVYFKGTAAGSVDAAASAGALTPAQQTETITAGADAALAFVTPPRNVTAGACSASLDVAVQDAYGNSAPQTVARTVGLSANPAAGFAFFSDAACATSLSSVTIGVGASTASLYVSGTTAGSVDVTAQSGGVASATQVVTVSALGNPTRLAFLTPPRTVVAGACSAALTVQTQDTFGNPRAVAADATVTLSVAPASAVQLFSDPGCTSAAATIVIGAGTTSASFYARGVAAGPATVGASSAPLPPTSQVVTVSPAAPAALVFTSSPQSVAAGACSGLVTIESRDALGNAAPPGADLAVALSAGGGLGFYSDASCTAAVTTVTVPAAGTTAGVYFRGTVAGGVTLVASSGALSPASQAATITAGAPSQLVFTTAALSVQAGTCSTPATVEVLDSFGNAVSLGSPLPVTLTQAGVPVTFFTGACAGATTQVTIAAGTSTASFTLQGTQAGAATVTATAAGLTPVSQGGTIRPAPADRFVFVTTPQALTAGVCSAIATIEARDPYGNASPVAAPTTLTLGAAPATGFAFFAAAGCGGGAVTTATMAGGSSQASVFFRGTSAGSVVVTADDGARTPATQTETVGPAAAASFQWDAVPPSVTIGVAFGVTLRARDAFGNLATSFTGTANLSISPAATTVACTAPCTSATTTDAFSAGVWTGTVTLGGAAGVDRVLTATQGGLTGSSSAFTVAAPSIRTPPLARFTATPRVVLAGASVTFDASGSSDVQTATAALEVSWDFLGTATGAPPWTAWTATKTAANTYAAPGVYAVRLAVRDPDGDVGYAVGRVHVLPAASAELCVVDTSSTADDGATSCSAKGPDGVLSLVEAIRVSNATAGIQTITFAGPMTIAGSGTLAMTDSVDVVGVAGVLLVGLRVQLATNNVTVRWFGIELSGAGGALAVSGNVNARFELYDSSLHDFDGIVNTAELSLEGVTVAACSGVCLATNGHTTVRFSTFRDSATNAIELNNCIGSPVVDVSSTVFKGVLRGVKANCNGTTSIRHNTFEASTTAGIEYQGGGTHVLVNNLFTNTVGTAVLCGSATFTTRSHHLLFGNAASGCVSGDPSTLTADPLYAAPGSNDYRLTYGSPAIDSALDVGLKVTQAPGTFLGAGPDRGGRETY